MGLFGFIYKVCYFLFNGVVYLFVDGEFRFEPSSLRLVFIKKRGGNGIEFTRLSGCTIDWLLPVTSAIYYLHVKSFLSALEIGWLKQEQERLFVFRPLASCTNLV